MEFAPLREILPVVRPKAADEILRQWIERCYEPRQVDQDRLWADHYASIADYWRHKQNHPDGHAGIMVLLYRWTPCLAAAASIVTFNPMGIAIALGSLERQSRRRWR
jgi:hypothetical protein